MSRRPSILPAAGAALGLLAAGGAAACDFCLVSQGISPLETLQGAGLRVAQRYTLLDSVYDGNDPIGNPGAQEEFHTTELSAFWSPRPGWLLLATLPVRVTRVDGHLDHGGGTHAGGEEEEEHHEEGEEHHHGLPVGHDGAEVAVHPQTGGDEGIGDFALLVRWTAFTRHTLASTTLVAVSAGMKTPTGATDGRADDGGFLDAHVQLGTGSVDALLGMSVSHSGGRWSLSVNLLGAVKGEGEAGNIDYEFGDSLNYDFTARWRAWPAVAGAAPRQMFVSLGLGGEARGREEEAGVELAASGGHAVFLTPGVQLNLGGQWVAEVAYYHPLHQSLNGIQLGDDYKVVGSLTYLF